ncbi:transporter associated domain protein [Neorickettsia helminthoeca str. Oregon]|uniref:Transporter associated domain protein n=1 Tax=Neorickettsia helminthoeca str. Oregon TaxID=1286528 RepID=X5HJR5_9RICK|nr:CNNM domain-containing protein [Neorickettsia helminthoeca]AHX11334.1 transporter associated domain protein [Neorickettsia helminthoeca str. Oregon]
MSGLLVVFFLILLFASLLLSCVFSGSETAITAVNPAKLTQLKNKGSTKAALLLELYDDKERVISTVLLCNNVANMFASSVSAFLVIDVFGSLGIIISTFVVSAVVVVFGEILPKAYAISHPEDLGMFLAYFISFVVKIFGPLVQYLNIVIKISLKWFNPLKCSSEILSPYDTIRGLLVLHKKSHSQQNVQKNLEVIGNILDITEIHVDKIMTHRRDVCSINIALSKEDIMRTVLSSRYRWIPLWKDKDDNFVKVLDASRLRIACANKFKINLRDYLEEPLFVPGSTLVSVQLHNFKVNKNDFSIVIDEYGNAIGVITFSDIMEEIIGEAVYTHNYQDIKESGDGAYIINGRIPIRDLNKKMGFNFPTENNHTFAGMIIDEIERIPSEGEIFEMCGCVLEILKKKSNKIVSVKLKRVGRSSQ